MALSKKHYEMFAKAICEARTKVENECGTSEEMQKVIGGANAALYELAVILSNEFYMENPKFDENKFMVATEVLFN